jgi:peptidoglycan hydrolase-like protein with peptidoglycan-binding domain
VARLRRGGASVRAGVETGAARAVARFQRAQGLAADGVVGSRTLVALYSRLGAPRPRLSGGGAS